MVTSHSPLRVLIAAEHASLQFGGEAALPLHYFRVLRKRHIDVRMVVHERTRRELEQIFSDDLERIEFIADTSFHRFLWRCNRVLPRRMGYFTFGMIMRLLTQLAQRRVVRRLITEHQVQIVHQPMPVSPKEPSMLYGLGVPVVIGPMNGAMDYPSAFRSMQGGLVGLSMAAGRATADLLNAIIPGKRHATTLLVANGRTRAALPGKVRGRILELVENGVDLSMWQGQDRDRRRGDGSGEPVRFVYVGRLVEWKAVDLLLGAFARAAAAIPAVLEIIGDGPDRAALEKQAADLGLNGSDAVALVSFAGWLSQSQCAAHLRDADVLILPSLMECGGAVVLEAMAVGLPVIATNWGGPADYLDADCGILVDPCDRETFINGLVAAMERLGVSAELRRSMGQRGRRRVEQHFDWETKAECILEIYREAIARTGGQ